MVNIFELQQTLLHAIFSESGATEPELLSIDQQGLAIYRANLRATATQALRITFPTVDALIGEDLMAYAAKQLLPVNPPHHGDWARWGEALAEILAQIDVLNDYPFIPDCARLDYICHQMVREADHVMDMDSLQVLQSHEPDDIKVVLAPSLMLIESDYPIAEIRAAHKLSEQARGKELANISQAKGERHYIACHRNGYEVSVTTISAREYRWYTLLKKHSLGESFNLIDTSEFSFEQWLLASVQNNVIKQFTLI